MMPNIMYKLDSSKRCIDRVINNVTITRCVSTRVPNWQFVEFDSYTNMVIVMYMNMSMEPSQNFIILCKDHHVWQWYHFVQP